MHSPSNPEVEQLLRIAEAARGYDGQPPFSDRSVVELRRGERHAILIGDAAAAIVSPTEAELVVAPDARLKGHGTSLLERIITGSRGTLRIWAHGDHPGARALAASHGLEPARALLQLRAPVPALSTDRDQIRANNLRLDHFRVGQDDSAWLQLNAKAFASHPEQGAVSRADFDELLSERWFSADDFLVLRDSGVMVGYCWLKIEREHGEFYVVGVDPDRREEGLGRRLMDAGFAQLAERGIRIASLYVEADNVAALRLYRSLGFTDYSVDIQYLLSR